MISTRYYLTILSGVPMLLAMVFLARRALKKLAGDRRLLRLWQVAVAGGVTLLLVSLFSEFQTSFRIPRPLAITAQTVINLFGLIAVAEVTILLALEFAARRLPASFRQDRRQALRVLTGVGLAAPIAAAGFGIFIERTNFEVCETTVGVRSLPSGLAGLRLLQISDIHLGPYLSAKTLAKVIDAGNELKAHIAFVTGDLITAKRDPLDACLAQVARLKTDLGTLGCLGNHEVYAGAVEHTVKQGARMGIDFLRQQAKSIRVGDAILNVAGVDYEPFDHSPHYLRHAEQLIQGGAVNVLLSHNPDVFPVAAAQGYDLTLSGHMHGGQVTLEFLHPALNPARIMTPFVRGLYRDGDRACYVTRGIGTLGVPVRIGSRPEITLLTLQPA
jgi:hypothetical protein